jgi:hypothetical protein
MLRPGYAETDGQTEKAVVVVVVVVWLVAV